MRSARCPRRRRRGKSPAPVRRMRAPRQAPRMSCRRRCRPPSPRRAARARGSRRWRRRRRRCPGGTVGFAVEHRQVVVQRREPSVVGVVDMVGAVERLTVEFLGLLVVAGGALRRGRVDERRRPCFGAFESEAQRELDRPLDDPLVVLVARLRAVEAHRLVEHGEQAGKVAGVLGQVHRVEQIGFGLRGRFVAGEDRVEAVQELVDVESGAVIGDIRIVHAACAVRIACAVRCRVRRVGLREGRRDAFAEPRQLRQQVVLVVRHRSRLSVRAAPAAPPSR